MAEVWTKDLPNYHLLRRLQQKRIKRLNDLFIEVSLAIQGLTELKISTEPEPRRQKYTVPKMRSGQRAVSRNYSQIVDYIDHRISYSEFAQSIVFAVAMTENYIFDVLATIMRAYPMKLTLSVKGNDGIGQGK